MAWDQFSSEEYWRHNYRDLRDDDDAIIHAVGSWFSGYFRGTAPGNLRGVDVGSGANLYPALAMLPFCNEIHLNDLSAANVEWLRAHAADTGSGEWSWQPFWDEFRHHPAYRAVSDVRRLLAERTSGRIRQGSVLDLEKGAYDIGTMFFVAESMTSYENEFEDATGAFLESLRPGAPFAAAFMDSSLGYLVGDKAYPAVRQVDRRVVDAALSRLGASARVGKVDVPANDPLRDGYQGMIIALGTAGP